MTFDVHPKVDLHIDPVSFLFFFVITHCLVMTGADPDIKKNKIPQNAVDQSFGRPSSGVNL